MRRPATLSMISATPNIFPAASCTGNQEAQPHTSSAGRGGRGRRPAVAGRARGRGHHRIAALGQRHALVQDLAQRGLGAGGDVLGPDLGGQQAGPGRRIGVGI